MTKLKKINELLKYIQYKNEANKETSQNDTDIYIFHY